MNIRTSTKYSKPTHGISFIQVRQQMWSDFKEITFKCCVSFILVIISYVKRFSWWTSELPQNIVNLIMSLVKFTKKNEKQCYKRKTKKDIFWNIVILKETFNVITKWLWFIFIGQRMRLVRLLSWQHDRINYGCVLSRQAAINTAISLSIYNTHLYW